VKFLLTIAVFLALLVVPLAAHNIITTKLTYTRDISCIFDRRCLSCHSASSSIPLTSYEEVRPWAVAVKEQVLARSMPPWGAVKGFGDFSPDAALTQDEMLIIAAWVVGGAPQGNPVDLPTQKSSPQPSPTPNLADALVVSTRRVIAQPLTIAGIRPTPDTLVDSARITARLPDGRVEPLVWLYRYDPRWNHVFRFSRPLKLPRGTVIEATSALQYYLEAPATAPSPAP
jgi:hypothetical protein